MNHSMHRLMFVVGVLALALVFSGASCSQKPVGSVDQGGETAMKTNTNAAEQAGTTINANQPGSAQVDVEAIVSSELGVANNDQAAVSSKDAEDRALVTSDSEAFSGVGAIEPVE